jgi:hypothetical protein
MFYETLKSIRYKGKTIDITYSGWFIVSGIIGSGAMARFDTKFFDCLKSAKKYIREGNYEDNRNK